MGDRLSKNQLDKLGSRLRAADSPTEEDLRLLDTYRAEFFSVHDGVIETLRSITSYSIESRHKSIPSIVAKLRRRSPSRLSAIQDMAGCRVIVDTMRDQDVLVESLVESFSRTAVHDRRSGRPWGYRAVHVIVGETLPFEIQVRTIRQHDWAELSERLADRYGFALKYGGGPPEIQEDLLHLSGFVGELEILEASGLPSNRTPEEHITAFGAPAIIDHILKRLDPYD